MDELIALAAGVGLGLMLLGSDLHTDWTPPFIIVFAIVAAVCLGALLIGALERRSVRAHRERMADKRPPAVQLEKSDGEA